MTYCEITGGLVGEAEDACEYFVLGECPYCGWDIKHDYTKINRKEKDKMEREMTTEEAKKGIEEARKDISAPEVDIKGDLRKNCLCQGG